MHMGPGQDGSHQNTINSGRATHFSPGLMKLKFAGIDPQYNVLDGANEAAGDHV